MLKVCKLRNQIVYTIMDCLNNYLRKRKYKIIWNQKNNNDKMKLKNKKK